MINKNNKNIAEPKVAHLKLTPFFEPTLEELVEDLQYGLFTPIDVQKYYADIHGKRGTLETEIAAKRLAYLMSQFNEYSLPKCWVYHEHERLFDWAFLPVTYRVDFHHVTPSPQDLFANKKDDSAFGPERGTFMKILDKRNIQTLFISGFNTNACVLKTVVDALKHGYKVYVLDDLTEDDIKSQDSVAKQGKTTYTYFIDTLCQQLKTEDRHIEGRIALIHSNDLLKALKVKQTLRAKKIGGFYAK